MEERRDKVPVRFFYTCNFRSDDRRPRLEAGEACPGGRTGLSGTGTSQEKGGKYSQGHPKKTAENSESASPRFTAC